MLKIILRLKKLTFIMVEVGKKCPTHADQDRVELIKNFETRLSRKAFFFSSQNKSKKQNKQQKKKKRFFNVLKRQVLKRQRY